MKHITYIIISTVLFLISAPLRAQNQGNSWYFGNHAGIKFNNGVPTATYNGATYNDSYPHSEGTSTISDSNGNLLFYSNGEKIWNKNHQIMLNGDSILGSLSSTQSSLILPRPKSSRYYYLFTTDGFWGNDLKNGFRYSVIDMCLSNGLGGVTSQKNIRLLDTVAEKLTAVRHSNGVDYWVITHEFNTDAFYAFLLTENGISDTIVSHSGSIHKEYCSGSTSPYKSSIGQLKASPDGLKLACVNGQTCKKISELFDFDPATGIVSNPIDLKANPSANGFYGVSFSPNSSLLYIASNLTDQILQFNISSGDSTTIQASKMVIATKNISPWFCSLQLAPNGKIYIAIRNSSYLGVINFPNVQGAGCNYVESAINLGTGTCSYGLPNLLDSYAYSNHQIPCGELGLDEEEIHSITLSPNPVSDYLTITSDKPLNNINITIYSVLGNQVKTLHFSNGNEFRIDCSELNKGSYYIEMRSNLGETRTFRQIIIE